MFDIEEMESQIRGKQKSIRYDIRNFPINMIIHQFRNGEFYIPTYQRGFVWSKKTQSRFVESMIIGLPTSSLFIAQTDDGRMEIIDGAQRIKTLEQYVNGDLRLAGLDDIPALNKTVFFDLSRSQQGKFLNRSISFITLSPETTFEARLEIFSRMNTGGMSRSSHEMRMALIDGPFSDFIRDLSAYPVFDNLLNISQFMKNRGEHEELILRFFALSDELNRYRGNMTTFLNRYAREVSIDFEMNRMQNEFERTCIFVDKYFRNILNQKGKRVDRVLFDSLFVGANLALRENPDLIPGSTSWVFESEYDFHIRVHAAQTQKRVRERIIYVKTRLLKGA